MKKAKSNLQARHRRTQRYFDRQVQLRKKQRKQAEIRSIENNRRDEMNKEAADMKAKLKDI